MFPDRVERIVGPLGKTLSGMTSIVETEVAKNTYRELPYTISRKIFSNWTPNKTVYESRLEGITLPVYRNYNVNCIVRRITTDLILSACGIGIRNPESPTIVVSIDNVPTDEPEPFEIYYDVRKKKQSPRIRGKEEEGMTELVGRTEKTYDFFSMHRIGFEKALRIIDEKYPYRSKEWDSCMDRITDECGLDFIKLQRRPRVGLNTPQRMRELMQRAYGPKSTTS